MDSCKLCDGELTEDDFDRLTCDDCGARYNDNARDHHDIELRDCYVEIRMVGEKLSDDREPHFSTEKEVIVHVGDDLNTINQEIDSRSVDHTFTFRGQDEIDMFGAGVHGEIYGEMFLHAKKVQLEDYTNKGTESDFYVILRD